MTASEFDGALDNPADKDENAEDLEIGVNDKLDEEGLANEHKHLQNVRKAQANIICSWIAAHRYHRPVHQSKM